MGSEMCIRDSFVVDPPLANFLQLTADVIWATMGAPEGFLILRWLRSDTEEMQSQPCSTFGGCHDVRPDGTGLCPPFVEQFVMWNPWPKDNDRANYQDPWVPFPAQDRQLSHREANPFSLDKLLAKNTISGDFYALR